MGRRLLFAFGTAAVTVVIATGTVETLVRLSGRRPWTPLHQARESEATYEPDPVLGWRAKPGRYARFRMIRELGTTTVSFLTGGRRATGPHRQDPSAQLLTVGCSFTEGWGLNDWETYPWLVQERFPFVEVSNFGGAGYGTYQSLLRLEQLLDEESPRPRIVVYGFIDDHERRNVAPFAWLKGLSLVARLGTVRVPYCTIRPDGTLVRHPPEGFPTWPLHDVLAAVAFAEESWKTFAARGRESQGPAVTRALLVEMAQLARRRGAQFVVALLAAKNSNQEAYRAFAREADINLADCTSPMFGTREMQLAGEQHPNQAMNRIWAVCLGKHLAPILADITSSSSATPR
jgi:hypothetical protein